MQRLSLLLLFIVGMGIQYLPAQDLHIYYNAFTDSLYFMQADKAVSRPVVRKGDAVVLHVENYNNYLYDLQVKTSQTGTSVVRSNPVNLTSLLPFPDGVNPLKAIFGAGNPLGGLSGITGLLRNFIKLPGDDDKGPILGWGTAPKEEDASLTAAEKERRARMLEIEQHAIAYNKALQKTERRAESIVSLQKDMETALEALNFQAFAAAEVTRLRYNPQLEPHKIKELSQEYMVYIFGEEDPRNVALNELLEIAGSGNKLAELRRRYEERVNLYAEEVGMLHLAAAAFADPRYDFPESKIQSLREEAKNVGKAATEQLNAYQSANKALAVQISQIKTMNAQELAALRTDFLLLMDNSFSKIHRQTASGDKMDLQLTFVPVDSAQAKGASTKSIAPISVKVVGGMQVNAGVGLGFGQFFEQPQTFFVRDSIIQSSDKEAFTPYLSSFVHFHPIGHRELVLGGSVGVGIPIAGGGGFDAITFFMGPSLALGQGQRIVINAGLIGGKVPRLANGYSVGDRFEAQPELLKTDSAYRLGYAVGVSFNLTGG